MRLAAPECLAETCTDSPSNIWIENSSRNSNKSLLGRNYFSMRFKGAEGRSYHHVRNCNIDPSCGDEGPLPSWVGVFIIKESDLKEYGRKEG